MRDLSMKHLQIKSANTTMIIVLSVAATVAVFSLVSTNALFKQAKYQNKVITARNKAKKQLEDNIKEKDKLVEHYQSFAAGDPNIIEGLKDDTAGDRGGENPRIVLDALPSTYDFPALTSSVEKIMTKRAVKINSISGTDYEIDNSTKSSSPNPEPVTMTFTAEAESSYVNIQELLKDFEKSIRPFSVTKLEISGKEDKLLMKANINTYYQPAKNLSIIEKVVPPSDKVVKKAIKK